MVDLERHCYPWRLCVKLFLTRSASTMLDTWLGEFYGVRSSSDQRTGSSGHILCDKR